MNTIRKQVRPTDEQIANALKKFWTRVESGECHVCGAKIESTEKVGRCVYARLCGHRLGQGGSK